MGRRNPLINHPTPLLPAPCRLMTPEVPAKVGLLPRLGSKFRYSGRTQYQSRMAASLATRQNPAFTRTLSGRKLSSRSMDGG